MMSSNVLSRFLPPANSPSVYEAIRKNDEESGASDLEERAGMTLPDGSDDHYSDHELEDALADATDSPIESPSTAFLTQVQPQPSTVRDEGFRHREPQRQRTNKNPRWLHPAASHAPDPDDGDEDVPASLLIEGDEGDEDLKARLPPPPQDLSDPESPAPGPSSRDHVSHPVSRSPRRSPRRNHWMGRRSRGGQHPALAMVDPKEKAMWRWANVENLDNFLKDVYIYFLGNGIWSILLSQALNLLTFAFVVGFTTFLTSCVNYSNFRGSKKLDDILIDRCMAKMSGPSTFLLWLLTFFWIGKLFQYLLDIRRLKHMHDFYLYLLGITDVEIQTISWQEVVSRLMALRDANPATANAVSVRHRKFMGSQSKQRMDAHDIANRLMRKENYLIALINKDILDLTLPLPFLRNRPLFSRTLEWNINLCVMDFVFNEQGQVRPLFLKDTYRRALSEGLRRRFIFAGIMNIFMAPFIVVYFLMHYFFRYFNEFKKNPSQIGSRQYTPLAEWKFREFNELWHLFERRINMSYPFAGRYVDQFPKDKTVQVARFVAFVTGALASVLALASVVDPELFLGFEITHDRTVLFYLGVFGSVWAVARGLVPEETDVFDPEFALLEVIDFTHYFPTHWKGRLHSDEVRSEFAALYQMKIVVFLEEILSMIFTPFVLWFSLPKCSDRLIDFFREFTVHVDGMGYLCSFAVFDFKKGTNVLSQGTTNRRDPARDDPRADYFSTKDGKMLASYYGFLDNYGVNHHRHAPARRHFHPPPAFPTLGSPAAGPSGPLPDRFDHIHSRPGASPAQFGLPSMVAGFSRLGVGATGVAEHHHSPVPSMLLDPHHQPSTSGFRSATRAAGRHPRHRRPARGSRPRADRIEDVDERSPSADARNSQTKPPPLPPPPATQAPPGGGSSSGQAGASESNLDASWRMNLAGDAEENETAAFDEGENVDELVGGGGVLGLIQQFQKVNSEGRGRTTVGI